MSPEILIKSYQRGLELWRKYKSEILRTASSISRKRTGLILPTTKVEGSIKPLKTPDPPSRVGKPHHLKKIYQD